jgi:hypothetical protein
MTESPSATELLHEADHGESERTPAIALTAVFVVLSAVVAVVVGIALILYYAV